MASNVLVIVEFGAQKQRISLNMNHSYKDICQQIYSLFKLDSTKSKYILQRQDSIRSDTFTNLEEESFRNELKHYANNNIKHPVMRLRLMPLGSKASSKSSNGYTNGGKSWSSTSSQCPPDDSDRVSTTSATTIDIKQLIKKCLANLKETTENIQSLDRYLHPEDYIDDESRSTTKSPSNSPQSSLPLNNINRQISQLSTSSDSRLPPSNIVDELVPALNHLLNTQKPSSLPTVVPVNNKPIEPPTSTPSIPTPIPTTNVPSRSSNKSFSNRLGMMMPSNQTLNTTAQEPKPIPVAHQYLPPKPKSPVNITRSIASPMSHKNPTPPASKCKIELKQFEPGTTIEGIVSVASNASYFFIQLIDQQKDEFDHLSKSLHEYYSNLDKNSHFRPLPGDFCVAMYTEDARWYRARIIRYVSDQICEVFYIDYGNMEELRIDLVHEILPEFIRLPARAIACTITEILPPIEQEGWTKRATFAFAQRCSNERVQAIVIDSTNIKWPMHIVQLRVAKTQEDVGAALENCKVARHVSNNDICMFWSNKIRLEQYILYNLPEPNVNRFPLIEQVPIQNDKQENINLFLSTTLQQSSSNESLSKEKSPENEDQSIVKEETISQTISTIVPEEEEFKEFEPVTSSFIEEQKEIVSSTPSSSLNPEATPFLTSTLNNIETTESISADNESDDEIDSNETPVSSDSSEHHRMPIKDEVIVDTNLMPSIPLIKSWLPVEVTHIETPTRFYIRYIYGPGWNLGNGQTPELIENKELPAKNVILNQLTEEMTQCYSKHKRIYPGHDYNGGELVAVKYRSKWHRGRFIQYKPNIDFAHIFFVDYGYTRSVPIQMIRPINNRFVVGFHRVHAEQAHLVHLYQPGQRRSRIEWNANSIDEFREMTKDGTHLYARTMNEPNTIDLMSLDPLTKKWFSFYEHFVKHLTSSDHLEESN